MTEKNTETGASGPRRAAALGHRARTVQWVHRAVGADGHERHTVLMVVKSALAAVVAWWIAHRLMAAGSPSFAPFSAVLIMQVTVYQSMIQTLRYIGAVSAGVAVQGVLGYLVGPDLLTFALVAVIALVIGRWRALGSQGSQVATAAFFAFSTYIAATSSGERWSRLGEIVLLVLVGCGVGVLVNTLVAPPLRHRSAESGVHTLAHSLCNLVGDMYPALREGQLQEERTTQWRRRASQLRPIAEQAQSAVSTAWESTYYNPRKLLNRHREIRFDGYHAVVDALERVAYQVGSMTRSFDQAREDDTDVSAQRVFLRHYGDLLAALAHIADLFAQVDERRIEEQSRELCSAAEDAQREKRELTRSAEEADLPLSDPSRPYGILLAEAVRLTDELQYSCDVLQDAVRTRPARTTSAA
ncbi:FUSC family protein [Streptomyces sp. TR06-5]|uniref:FUSC family protein n=1 Tax=unclassified Streptomyces TaxID=2593676 RepID=UPI00399F093E